MKVKSSIKRLCGYCQIIRRGKTLYVRCQKFGKHKQRQGFHTSDQIFELGDPIYCECPSQINLFLKNEDSCCSDDKFDLFTNNLI